MKINFRRILLEPTYLLPHRFCTYSCVWGKNLLFSLPVFVVIFFTNVHFIYERKKSSPSGTGAILATPARGKRKVANFWISQVVLSSFYFSWRQRSGFQHNLNRSQLLYRKLYICKTRITRFLFVTFVLLNIFLMKCTAHTFYIVLHLPFECIFIIYYQKHVQYSTG